jgi:hypothetical protein
LPDGKSVAAALSYDRAGNPRVFDVNTARERSPSGPNTPAGAQAAKYLTGDGRFAVWADDHTVYVRDAWRAVIMRVELGADVDGGECQVAVSLDGSFLAVAGIAPDADTATAVIWQRREDAYVLSRRFLLTGLGRGDFSTRDYGGLTITPDGGRLLTRNGDQGLLVWDSRMAARSRPPSCKR